MIDEVKEGEMPMSSYLIIHKDAKLSQEQKNALINWAEQSIATLSDTIKK